jgi:hypothetical protein
MVETAMIDIEPGPGRSRIRLPVREAEFSFTRGSRLQRMLSGLPAIMATLFLTGPLTWAVLLVERATPPEDGIDIALAVLVGFSAISFAIGMWFMGGMMLLGFVAERADIEVGTEGITVRSRQGPFRRTRRMRDLRLIHILPPASINASWQRKPLESKTSRIVVQTENGRSVAIAAGRLYAVNKEVASAILAMISRHGGRPCALRDHVDPSQRQTDSDVAPRGAEYRVERLGDNTAIVPVNQKNIFIALLGNAAFRTGIWIAVLPYLLFTGVVHLWPEVFGLLRPLIPKIGFAGLAYGLLFMGLMWYGFAFRRMYLITTEHLVRLTDVRIWRWSKAWKRGDIAAVRVGQSVGDQGRPFDVLELVLRSGETVKLQSGSLDCVRYLATLLRNILGVSAEAPARAAVAAVPPAKCPFEIHRGHGRVGATKTAPGWTAAHVCYVAIGAAVMAGAIAAPLLGWKHLGAESRGVAVLLALAFGAMGALLVITAAFEATNCVRLWFDDMNGLHFVSASAFGTKQLRLRHHEVKEIAAEPAFAGNPKGQTRLVVVRAKDERTILLNGRAELIRYLADALTLDARGEQHSAERIRAKR